MWATIVLGPQHIVQWTTLAPNHNNALSSEWGFQWDAMISQEEMISEGFTDCDVLPWRTIFDTIGVLSGTLNKWFKGRYQLNALYNLLLSEGHGGPGLTSTSLVDSIPLMSCNFSPKASASVIVSGKFFPLVSGRNRMRPPARSPKVPKKIDGSPTQTSPCRDKDQMPEVVMNSSISMSLKKILSHPSDNTLCIYCV